MLDHSFGHRGKVIKKTCGEIRTFLDEIANGTSNYKSLHNLTEQVEHQYHGRFLIELIQNAHDALFEIDPNSATQDNGRIDIVISVEQPCGALYVANDGSPFTESNFDNLSRFGQSDKDPEKHIGNKGIGFRSVLEITSEPEIYSRKEIGSVAFDGFNFRFSPSVTRQIEKPIIDLLCGNDNPLMVFGGAVIPLIDWRESKIGEFRAQSQRCGGQEGTIGELKFLSPYLLPEPIYNEDFNTVIGLFERKGFATVIRLPFRNKNARDLAVKKINELDENTILFLKKAKSLWIDTPESKRYITRKTKALPEFGDAEQVDISVILENDNCANGKRFWLWDWPIGGEDKPDESEAIREAVHNLPGKWPKIRKVELGLATCAGEIPDKGIVSIFLPTEQLTGVSAHINAPFYGDISRTFVDFSHPYNDLLVGEIAKKAVYIILKHLAFKDIDHARAILDIICPVNHQESSGIKWSSLMRESFSKCDRKIEQEPILLTMEGWKSIEEARLLPDCKKLDLITEDQFYQHAAYPVIEKHLFLRAVQIENLLKLYQKLHLPNPEQIAATLENLTHYYSEILKVVDWNRFWHDTMELLPPKSASALHGKKIFLGTDGELHAIGNNMSMFLRPRSSGDDEEVLPDRSVDDIPQELRSHVAFLHESITVHIPREGGGIRNHPLHGYLSSSGLVQPFGVESILRNVLIPATPRLPVPIDGEENLICRAIINWGIRLIEGLVAKEKGDKTLQYLGELPAPCYGGWYPLKDTSFGPGWIHTVGRELNEYLKAAKTRETKEALKQTLLGPDDDNWGNNLSINQKLLERAGAFDGIRLFAILSKDWVESFNISRGSGVKLPDKAPPAFDSETWLRYSIHVHRSLTPVYDGLYPYRAEGICTIPGIDRFSQLSVIDRENLMKIILRSIARWQSGWETICISKIGGAKDNRYFESPLKFWLKETPWMVDRDKVSPEFKPMDRWLIPQSTLLGRANHFKHLNPLPMEISWLIDSDPNVYEQLKKLGLPKYNPTIKSNSARLLNDLASSMTHPEEIANWDIFWGQVRTAWNLFEPNENDLFPQTLIVKTGTGLQAICPTEENPVYLPNDSSSIHYGLEGHIKNILAIDSKDAKRIESGFIRCFGNKIRLISDVKAQPLVNGKPWDESLAGELLCESEISWIIPVLLNCHAHAGNFARGPHTKSFSNAMATIRKSRAIWVDSLQIGIWEGEQCYPVSNLSGIWLPKAFALLATYEARNNPMALGEAFSSMMDRADLEVPLKLVLSKMNKNLEPKREVLENALLEIKIHPEHISEIEQLWLGDLGYTIRLLKPLLKILRPGANLAGLVEITNEDELKGFLMDFNLSPLENDKVLSLARKSSGFFDFGKSLFENYGKKYQLDKWNSALSMLGEAQVINAEAPVQFRDILDSAQLLLRAILKTIARDNPQKLRYPTLAEQLESISIPEEIKKQYWEVDFSVAMVITGAVFGRWGAPSIIIQALTESANAAELISKLELFKIEHHSDPLEIYASNRSFILRTVQAIQKAGILWCLRNNGSTSLWDSPASNYLESYDAFLDEHGYLDILEFRQIVPLFVECNYNQQLKTFFDALLDAHDFEGFLKFMGMNQDDIDKSESKLEEVKLAAEKQKRNVVVCGKNFDNLESNLDQLFGHIESAIVEGNLPSLDLDKLAILNEMKEAVRRRTNQPVKKAKAHPKKRMTQSMKDLIGLLGEIHAFRALRKKYGVAIVGPSNWISENSTYVFPKNLVSDEYGYDFKLQENGKIYYIEVKASQGDEQVFELGSSEIRKAIEIANKRKEKYIIFHITEALSSKPIFQFLPNPYDKQYRNAYKIFDAGLRIQYDRYRN